MSALDIAFALHRALEAGSHREQFTAHIAPFVRTREGKVASIATCDCGEPS